MNVVIVILYTLIVMVSVLLIGLVLIQQSKGGGFGTAFGGVGESVFGAHAGSHLTKLTVILVSIFFMLALSLAILTGHRGTPQSIVEQELISAGKKTVAAKTAETEEKKADATVQESKKENTAAAQPLPASAETPKTAK